MEKLLEICLKFMPIPAILFVITVHSLTKAVTTSALGDNLAKNEGRLTLNPFKHVDAIGFILLFLMYYGWDKPVRTSTLYYKNKKLGIILVNASPIAACLLVAMLSVFIYNHFLLLLEYGYVYRFISSFLSYLALYGINMAVFNLIPIYPMDASGLIRAFLSPNNVIKFNQIEGILQIILVFALMLGVLNSFLGVISNLVLQLISFI